jgi:nicotinamide mononucleotide transporter
MLLNWISDNWFELFGAITGILYVFLEIRQNIWLWPVGIITSTVYIWIFFTSKFYADMSLQVYYLVISCVGWYWWIKGAGHRAQGTGQEEEDGKVGEWESEGLRDKETKGLRDEETKGRRDEETKGRRDEETKRRRDEETKGRRDEETKGRRDKETKRRRDNGTGGLIVTRLKFKIGIILVIVFVLLYFVLWFVLSRFTDSPVPEADSFITSLSIVATWMLARKIYEHWYLWIIVNTASAILFITRGLYPTVILYFVYFIMSFTGIKVWKKFCVKRET